MVAAWISAETGVGPSMASGSQTYSGNCADLPVAPMNSSSAIDAQHAEAGVSGVETAAAQSRIHVGEAHRAEHAEHQQHAEDEAASPTRLTMNAFLPASPADFLWK